MSGQEGLAFRLACYHPCATPVPDSSSITKELRRSSGLSLTDVCLLVCLPRLARLEQKSSADLMTSVSNN